MSEDGPNYSAFSLRLMDDLADAFRVELKRLATGRAIRDGKDVVTSEDVASCFDAALKNMKSAEIGA